MSSEALKRAKELEAEAKSLRRAEKKFWDEVDLRKEEILSHFGLNEIDNVGQESEILSDIEEDIDLDILDYEDIK